MVTVTPSRRSSGATCGTPGTSGNGRLEYLVSRMVTFPWVRDFPKLTSAAAIDRLATNRISNRFIVYTPGMRRVPAIITPGGRSGKRLRTEIIEALGLNVSKAAAVRRNTGNPVLHCGA